MHGTLEKKIPRPFGLAAWQPRELGEAERAEPLHLLHPGRRVRRLDAQRAVVGAEVGAEDTHAR